MKVISYVNGTLTIILNDKDFIEENADKPEFITGDNFYYEPSLKQMDDVPLTDEQILEAETFIANFKFPISKVSTLVHVVDKQGNYLGEEINDDNKYTTVPNEPPHDLVFPYWNETKYVEGMLVDANTNKCLGQGDNRTMPNSYYAPKELLDTDFNPSIQEWDKTNKKFNIHLDDAKRCKKMRIKNDYAEDIGTVINADDFALYEVTSFSIQESEAKAYKADNQALTPFIDGLLESRNIDGETKSDLVINILVKAEAFKHLALKLGKCQRLIKEIDNAVNLEELRAIKWS